MLELFQQGGAIMWVLLALSVVALAIVLAKALQFLRAGIRRTAFVEPVLEQLHNQRPDQALELLAQEKGPVAAVMRSAIECGLDPALSVRDVEAEVSRVGSNAIRALESWLRGLSSIAHLSPLLGLLGTVTGMIAAFIELEAAGPRVDPSILSGGIWEALLTTAFGLTVAIPAMAAFYLLEGEVDGARAAMKDATVRVLRHFGKSPERLEGCHEPRLEDETHGL